MKREIAFINFLLYLVPSLSFVLIFFVIPFISTVIRSLFRFKIATYEVLGFAGVGNYFSVLRDTAFQVSFINSLILGFAGALPAVLVGLLTATICNQKFRGNGIILSIVVAAWAIPPIIAGRIWRMLFLPNGLISTIASWVGLSQRSYSIIGDPSLALLAVVVASIWKFSPFAALILLGGMQTIPPQLYEAAKIDGASAIMTFRHITLPLLARYFNIALLFVNIYLVATVDLIYAMTGGGPGYASEILASYVYKMYFLQQDFGKGGALSVLLILWGLISLAPLLYIIYRQIFRRDER